MEQPSDDTPSVSPSGCQLPQRGSRETFPFNVPPGNRNVAGDFHRPYETQMTVPFSIQPAAQKPQGCGRFSSPLRNSKFFTFHHSTNDTPSVSPCGLPAPSEREPGGVRTIQRAAQKPQRCGRFSSPLRKLGNRFLLPSNRVLAKPEGYGRFSSPLRKLRNCFLLPCNQPKA